MRSKPRASRSEPTAKTAITLRLEDDLYQIVHLIAAERQESLNEAVQYMLSDWWEKKSDRGRYEQFLGRPLRRR